MDAVLTSESAQKFMLTLLEFVLSVLSVWISTKLVPWLNAHVKAKDLDHMRTVAMVAVNAAEQIFPDVANADKKAYATGLVKKLLPFASPETVDALIEEAVAGLKVITKQLPIGDPSAAASPAGLTMTEAAATAGSPTVSSSGPPNPGVPPSTE